MYNREGYDNRFHPKGAYHRPGDAQPESDGTFTRTKIAALGLAAGLLVIAPPALYWLLDPDAAKAAPTSNEPTPTTDTRVVSQTATIHITNDQKREIFLHAEAVSDTLKATIRPEVLNKARPGSRLAEILSISSIVKKNDGDVRAVDGKSVLHGGYWILGQNEHPRELGYTYHIDSADFNFTDPELRAIFSNGDLPGFSLDLSTNYVNQENHGRMGLPQRWYMRLTPHNPNIDLTNNGSSSQIQRIAEKILKLRGPSNEIGHWSNSYFVPNVLIPPTYNGFDRVTVQHDIYSQGKVNPKTGEASNYRSVSTQANDFGQITVNFHR